MLTKYQNANIIDCSGGLAFKGSIVIDGERIFPFPVALGKGSA